MIDRLARRVVGLLTRPREEWSTIAAEPSSVAALFRDYIAVLSAIPAVALLAGMARFSLAAGVWIALGSYAARLGALYATGAIVQAVAPRFRSRADLAGALKLVGYAHTPVWLAGVFYVFLTTSPLVLVAGVWAVYLFYLGLPAVAGTPAEARVPFVLVAVIATLAVDLVMTAALQSVGLPFYGF